MIGFHTILEEKIKDQKLIQSKREVAREYAHWSRKVTLKKDSEIWSELNAKIDKQLLAINNLLYENEKLIQYVKDDLERIKTVGGPYESTLAERPRKLLKDLDDLKTQKIKNIEEALMSMDGKATRNTKNI